jgi:hypothetical protein
VLLLDVVLGYGSDPDPSATHLPALPEAGLTAEETLVLAYLRHRLGEAAAENAA